MDDFESILLVHMVAVRPSRKRNIVKSVPAASSNKRNKGSSLLQKKSGTHTRFTCNVYLIFVWIILINATVLTQRKYFSV